MPQRLRLLIHHEVIRVDVARIDGYGTGPNDPSGHGENGADHGAKVEKASFRLCGHRQSHRLAVAGNTKARIIAGLSGSREKGEHPLPAGRGER